ncbi:RRM domain-containing protein, partial [Haematococcus lacustris]
MFVAGFNFLSTERDVERRFGRYGNVTEVRIVRDPTGKSRGFGFVAMDNEEDVRECIRNMNGRDWEGRRLQVELCRHP